MSVTIGADGLARCPWGNSAPEYVAYHDQEWGRPVRDEHGLYERMCLEAFQSGLSWITILRKRENFRRAFDGFTPAKIAEYTEDDVTRLMADAGIVRNRAKILATIANARATLALNGALPELIWRFADPDAPVPKESADVPATTPGSKAMSKELKRHGFAFVGPTTAYAMMQACGLVNDHLADCCARSGAC